MKTPEEYLKSRGLKNPLIDSSISGGGSAPRTRVSDTMKEYAKEVAKQALKNASASLIKHYFIDHSDMAIDSKEIEEIINCEDNIPEI